MFISGGTLAACVSHLPMAPGFPMASVPWFVTILKVGSIASATEVQRSFMLFTFTQHSIAFGSPAVPDSNWLQRLTSDAAALSIFSSKAATLASKVKYCGNLRQISFRIKNIMTQILGYFRTIQLPSKAVESKFSSLSKSLRSSSNNVLCSRNASSCTALWKKLSPPNVTAKRVASGRPNVARKLVKSC